jgi:hypothetical protein
MAVVLWYSGDMDLTPLLIVHKHLVSAVEVAAKAEDGSSFPLTNELITVTRLVTDAVFKEIDEERKRICGAEGLPRMPKCVPLRN